MLRRENLVRDAKDCTKCAKQLKSNFQSDPSRTRHIKTSIALRICIMPSRVGLMYVSMAVWSDTR